MKAQFQRRRLSLQLKVHSRNFAADSVWESAMVADVEHYKQRLRDLLPYVQHTNECAYSKWRVAEFLQKSYGTAYSAGPMPACTCGCAAIVMIVQAEVGEQPSLETGPATFGLEINGEAQSVKHCSKCDRDFIGGKSDKYCGGADCVLEPDPETRPSARCEQCDGKRYVQMSDQCELPCSACNAMGESPALNR